MSSEIWQKSALSCTFNKFKFSVNEFKTVYVFENKSWNGRVPAGGKVNVGFEGKFPTGAVDTPNLMGKDFVGKDKDVCSSNSECHIRYLY